VTPLNVVSWAIDFPNNTPKAISVRSNDVACALETATDVQVRTYDLDDGGLQTTTTISSFPTVSDMAASGNVIGVVGGGKIAGITGASVSFNLPFNSTSHDFEVANKVVYDPSSTSFVFFGHGEHLVLNDRDLIVMKVSTNGATTDVGSFGTAIDEIVLDGGVAPNGQVLVLTHKFDVTPRTELWSLTPALNLGSMNSLECGTRTGKALMMLDDDIAVVDTAVGNALRVRLIANTMVGLYLMTYQPDLSECDPRQVIVDVAGNFFVSTNYDPDAAKGTAVARLSYASLSTPATVLLGGSNMLGTVTLAQVSSLSNSFNLASSNPAVASVPASVLVPNGSLSANFTITSYPVNANTAVTINANRSGFVAQRTITILPSNIAAVSVSPNVILGGNNSTGTATLTGPAPTSGRTVQLSTSLGLVATVPPSVTVPSGQVSANFTVFTAGVQANTGVVLSGTIGATTKTAFFAVNAPSLTTLTLSPTTVVGGNQTVMTLGLDGIAPVGGRSIVLISGAPGIVFVPGTGVVPQAATTVNLNINTAVVTSSINVTVFATRSGIYKTTTLTVTP